MNGYVRVLGSLGVVFFLLSLIAGSATAGEARFALAGRAEVPVPAPVSLTSFSLSQPAVMAESAGPRKHPWLAGVETFSINVGVWAFDRYVSNDPAARIGWPSWKSNLRQFFGFDNDAFLMNFVGHPFHGSQYFNSARSLGMNFWESVPYAFGGSLMWEFFGETSRPSTDDLILTTTCGICLGEVLFRMSSQVLDDTATGGNRTGREILGFLIDPIKEFNRIVSGDAWRTTSTNGQEHENLLGTFALGDSIFSDRAGLSNSQSSLNVELEFLYGDPDWSRPMRAPFDLIVFDGSLRFGHTFGSYLLTYAPLAAGRSQDDSGRKWMYGLFQNFDFFKNQGIEFGGTSFTGGLVGSQPLGGGFHFDMAAQLGALVFGASNNPQLVIGSRDYNYGWGPVGKLDLVLGHQRAGSFLVRLAHYEFFTFSKSSPEAKETRDILTYLRGQLTLNLVGPLGVQGGYAFFLRRTHFEGLPNFSQNNYEATAGLILGF